MWLVLATTNSPQVRVPPFHQHCSAQRDAVQTHRAQLWACRGCRAGEGYGWDDLFAEHYAAVGRFVFQISSTFSREDSDEICQEVFLSVIKNLAGFGGKSRLQTWLFRIAANKARDYHAKKVAAKRGGGDVPLSLHAEDGEGNRLLDPASPLAAPAEEWSGS